LGDFRICGLFYPAKIIKRISVSGSGNGFLEEESPQEKKKGKPNIAPLNRLPLLPSDPGGVQQELVVPACRVAKI
jgi:hypothetical protein